MPGTARAGPAGRAYGGGEGCHTGSKPGCKLCCISKLGAGEAGVKVWFGRRRKRGGGIRTGGEVARGCKHKVALEMGALCESDSLVRDEDNRMPEAPRTC